MPVYAEDVYTVFISGQYSPVIKLLKAERRMLPMDDRFESHDLPEKNNANENEASHDLHSENSEMPLKKRKKQPDWKTMLPAVCFALAGSLAGSVITLAIQNGFHAQEHPGKEVSYILESRRNAQLEILPVEESGIMTPAQVYAANVNSTVGITTAITTNFWGYQTTSAASGSGFILSNDGYILTNYHVIENSSSISVSLYNGTAYDAALIGYDESNDIAVLKVEADNLIPVVLGSSEKLNVGDSVVAIGNPLGELTFSLTAGTVSAKDRKVTLSSTVTMDLIQTDCAINSGNSGGALFNLYGEVVGITNAKYSTSSASEASIDNIGFAIPVDDIMQIVESIIEKGYVSKPYIGIMVSDVSPETQLYGIPKGAAVQSVTNDSPAAKAGLQTGDIVTYVKGEPVGSSSDLVDMVRKSLPGDTLVLTVFRQGQTMEVTVIIEEQIQSALENPPQESQQATPGNLFPGFPFGDR